jgi:hypothetical protein
VRQQGRREHAVRVIGGELEVSNKAGCLVEGQVELASPVPHVVLGHAAEPSRVLRPANPPVAFACSPQHFIEEYLPAPIFTASRSA